MQYVFYTYNITIKKPIILNKKLVNITAYFFSIINILRIFDSNYNTNNKVILNTYINILKCYFF